VSSHDSRHKLLGSNMHREGTTAWRTAHRCLRWLSDKRTTTRWSRGGFGRQGNKDMIHSSLDSPKRGHRRRCGNGAVALRHRGGDSDSSMAERCSTTCTWGLGRHEVSYPWWTASARNRGSQWWLTVRTKGAVVARGGLL
jgi:hypothetical protein